MNTKISINDSYVNLSKGIFRPVSEFYSVPKGIKKFNLYINSLTN